MSGAEQALFYLNFIAEVVLLYRLLHFTLFRTYLSLFVYWLLQALSSVVLMALPLESHRYVYVYWGAQTIIVLTAIFVVQDIYRIALVEHPAVASLARRTVLGAMTVAAIVALSGITLDSAIRAGQSPAVHRFATFERSMNFI